MRSLQTLFIMRCMLTNSVNEIFTNLIYHEMYVYKPSQWDLCKPDLSWDVCLQTQLMRSLQTLFIMRCMSTNPVNEIFANLIYHEMYVYKPSYSIQLDTYGRWKIRLQWVQRNNARCESSLLKSVSVWTWTISLLSLFILAFT